MKVILALAAILAVAYAQGPGALNSYQEIRRALRRGDDIQLNINSEQCASSNTDTPIIVSMPLRHWQIITTENSESIRADDFYVYNQLVADSDSAVFAVRHLRINDDESVEFVLSFTGGDPEPVTINCQIDEGAVGHSVVPGNDLEIIDEYFEVKSLLLFGDHVEAVVNFEECSNAADVLPEGVTNILLGFQTHVFNIINDGTPDELLVIDDAAVIGLQDGTETVLAEQLVILPDDSAIVTVAVLDLNDFSVLMSSNLTCSLGPAVRFTIDERENEQTFITYDQLKESTLTGHDIEAVIFLDFCELLEGEVIPETGVIWGARYDNFELVPAGSMAGNDLEQIVYDGYLVTVDGTIVPFDVTVAEDDVATVEVYYLHPGSDTEDYYHLWSCPLESAAVFHAVGRTRNEVNNFNQIIQEVTTRGQTYEAEIDFSQCDTTNFPIDVVVGGIVWESYINPGPDGFYFGSISTLGQTNINGTLSPAWKAIDILVLPDETAFVTPRLFDFATGEDLLPGAPENAIECGLSSGGPGGNRGLWLYRYPA